MWGIIFYLVLIRGEKVTLGEWVEQIVGVKIKQGRSGRKHQQFNFSIELKKLEIHNTSIKGYYYLHLGEEFIPTGRPGEPQIPMKTFVVTLPKNVKITGVEIKKIRVLKLKEKIKLIPMPYPGEWKIEGKKVRYVENKKVYSLTNYFPGKFISYESGASNDSVHCYIRIYPLQYLPHTKECLLLVEGEIYVYYETFSLSSSPIFSPDTCRSVIITSPLLSSLAESLKTIYQQEFNFSTSIVTTDWIESNFQEAPDPSWQGYAQTQPSFIVQYNYSLAKKIINYLRDTNAHPNLTHITLLGSSLQVPPSYYFTFDEWTPTDFLYNSPDYDFVPNYTVGRLPARNKEEAQQLVEKIKNWAKEVDWSWFSNSILTGGIPFKTQSYFGELICTDVLNKNFLNGHKITTCYFSDGNFTANKVNNLFSQGMCGIVYHLSHGSGDGVKFDDRTVIDTSMVLAYPQTGKLPIFISIACVNGAFDCELIQDFMSASFGETIVRARGGGIAYIGGARSNAGLPLYSIDSGNVVINKQTYMAGMLSYILEEYHLGEKILGEIIKKAINKFISNNEINSDTLNQWTLFCFTLLGSPLLKLPPQQTGSSYTLPKLKGDFDLVNSSSYPLWLNVEKDSIRIDINTNSPWVKFKYINATELTTSIHSSTLTTSPFTCKIFPKKFNHLYLGRAKTSDYKEGWFYFYVGGKIIVDGEKGDWEYYPLLPVAEDLTDFEELPYDLTKLYVTCDEKWWYIGFDVLGDNEYRTFGVAIDCKEGGYTGERGNDYDAMKNWITFGKENGVEYEVYVYQGEIIEHDTVEKVYEGILYKYDRGRWLNLSDEDNISYIIRGKIKSKFVEIAISKELLNPDSISLIVFSALMDGENPAQDACPSDPASYQKLTYGRENANTLTKFITIRKTGVEEKKKKTYFTLSQNTPNPFRKTTKIRFVLNKNSKVILKVYNLQGRLIKTLVEDVLPMGRYVISWDGKDSRGKEVGGGVYFYKLRIKGGVCKSKKMILIK